MVFLGGILFPAAGFSGVHGPFFVFVKMAPVIAGIQRKFVERSVSESAKRLGAPPKAALQRI